MGEKERRECFPKKQVSDKQEFEKSWTGWWQHDKRQVIPKSGSNSVQLLYSEKWISHGCGFYCEAGCTTTRQTRMLDGAAT